MDYALDLSIHGLTVSGGKVTEVTDGVQEMIQRIVIAIKTHLGEQQLNTLTGLPWTEEILVKNPNLDQITSRARAYIMSIEGVTNVIQLDIVLDPATREMDWTLNVETTSGVTGPFNVTS
jgi:hypothetical protein